MRSGPLAPTASPATAPPQATRRHQPGPPAASRKPGRATTITLAAVALWAVVLSMLWPLALTAPRAPANLTTSPRHQSTSQPARTVGQARNHPADTWA